MLEQLSQSLREQPSRPNPLYGQLTLVLVLVTFLTGWYVYGRVATQLDNLLQRPVLASAEEQIQVKL